MARTLWGDEIPDEYDARREGSRSRCYDRNPYDSFGVSRQEEEAHYAWQRAHDAACEERRAEERREERRAEERAEERRLEEARREEYEREQYEQEQYERSLAEQEPPPSDEEPRDAR